MEIFQSHKIALLYRSERLMRNMAARFHLLSVPEKNLSFFNLAADSSAFLEENPDLIFAELCGDLQDLPGPLTQTMHRNTAPVISLVKDAKLGKRSMEIGATAFLEIPQISDQLIEHSVTQALGQREQLRSKFRQQQAAFFDLLADMATPSLLFHRESLSIVQVNKAASDFYAYSHEEMCRLKISDLQPDISPDLTAAQGVATEEFSTSARVRHKTSNGRTFPIQLKTLSLPCSDYAILQILHRHAEDFEEPFTASYLAKKQKLELVLEESSDIIYDWNLTDNELIWNHAVTKQLGFQPMEIDSIQGWLKKVHPSDRQSVVQKMDLILASNTPVKSWEMTYRILLKNGKILKLKDKAQVIFSRGKATQVMGIVKLQEASWNPFQDDLERTIAELERSKNISSRVINSTDDMIMAINRELELLLANDSFFNNMNLISGRNYKIGDKVLSYSDADWLLGESSRNFFKAKYEETFRGNSPVFYFPEQASEQLGDLQYQVSLYPVYHPNGRDVVAITMFAKDMTKNRQYINAIRKQNDKLREIAWIQSHVVRAPLAKIIGLVNLLGSAEEMNSTDSKKSREYLLKSAEELDAIIRSIISKAELIYVDDENEL